MKREACKFFSGAFAALAYVHVAYAVATSRGIVSEPVFLGRRWGVKFMWTESAVYSAVGLALGYAGWLAEPVGLQPKTLQHRMDGQTAPVAETPQLVSD